METPLGHWRVSAVDPPVDIWVPGRFIQGLADEHIWRTRLWHTAHDNCLALLVGVVSVQGWPSKG